MKTIRELMQNQVLLPIIQADTADEGVAIAQAMADGGIHLVEVVLRTESSLAALRAIKKAMPELIVGAGTITCGTSLNQAIDAGADFIVTPAISTKLLTELKQSPVPVLPGVSNSADILLATEFGHQELKLFPASLSGGAKFIDAVSTVFPNTVFCPTGGVNQDNKTDYLTLNNCFAVGGTWIAQPQWVKQKDWHKITRACRLANYT